jgi:acyl-CoA thioester hydrolase
MFSFDTTLRVRYAETDQMAVVYHGNYFEYFEYARTESIRQLGATYNELEKSGTSMPIREVQARYLKPARYDEMITIRTILKELPRAHKIEFHHEVYNEKNELLVTGRVVLVFIDMKSQKLTTIPDYLLKKIEPFFS